MSSDNNDYDALLDESFDYEEDDYEEIDFGDDFAEDDGFEDDFSSIEDDDYGQSEVYESNSQRTKKKGFGLDFNTIVIIGAVILGGLIMMYQINSKKPPPTAPSKEVFQSALQMEGTFEGPGSVEAFEKKSATGQVENSSADAGFLFDTDSLSVDIADNKDALSQQAQETVIQAATSNNEPEESVAEVEVIPEKIILPSEDKVDLRTPESQRAEFDVFQQEAVMQAEKKQVVEEPIIDAAELIDEVKVVEIIGEEVPVITEVVPEVTSVAVFSEADDVQSMRARLEKMEQELINVKSSYEETIRGLESKVASLKQGASKANTAQNNSVPRRTAKKSSSKQGSSLWELRAAQPGRAWVSKKGQKQMQPIVVGDKLPGLGRVQNILHQNNKWVVIGSQGKITQ
jgi:intracellular multiplication protein IcmG